MTPAPHPSLDPSGASSAATLLGFDPTSLRQMDRRLRRLAERIATDLSEADDLVQEVWRTAIESPPRSREAVGGWLRTVLRNRFLRERRTGARRLRREECAARQEAVPPPNFEHEEVLERVRALVAASREPYRSTLRGRYLEGESVRELAARQQVSEATVKSRLQRGLLELRRRVGSDPVSRWFVAVVAASAAGVAPAKAADRATGRRASDATRRVGWEGVRLSGIVVALFVAVSAWVVLDSRTPAPSSSRPELQRLATRDSDAGPQRSPRPIASRIRSTGTERSTREGVETPRSASDPNGAKRDDGDTRPVERSIESATPTETRSWFGSVTVLDDFDTEAVRRPGLITFSFEGPEFRQRVEVEIVDRMWRLELPSRIERITIEAIDIGMRRAEPERSSLELGSRSPTEPISITAHWRARKAIVVRDRASGRALSPIEVRLGQRFEPLLPIGVGHEQTILECDASPCELPDFAVGELYVRAAGSAWTPIRIDQRPDPAPWVAYVGPGLDLLVEVESTELLGLSPTDRLIVAPQVTDGGRPLSAIVELRDFDAKGRFRVVGLPIRPYRVAIETDAGRTLGAVDFVPPSQPSADRVCSIRVPVDRDATREATNVALRTTSRVSGRFRVPAAWTDGSTQGAANSEGPPPKGAAFETLLVRRADEPFHPMLPRVELRPDPEGGELHRFEVALAPGRYVLHEEHGRYAATFEVTAETESFEFEVPPPAIVDVEVYDRATGRAADVEALVWTVFPSARHRQSNDANAQLVRSGPDAPRFTLVLPQGEVFVQSLRGDGEATITVAPGRQSYALAWSAPHQLLVTLTHRGERIPLADLPKMSVTPAKPGESVSIRPALRQGRLSLIASGPLEAWLTVSHGELASPPTPIRLRPGVDSIELELRSREDGSGLNPTRR